MFVETKQEGEIQIGPKVAPVLPRFKPRFWYRSDRLDARPVIWSLYNHPEEWQTDPQDSEPFWRLLHKPSGHVFQFVHGARLVAPRECSCLDRSRGYFQKFQSAAFKRAGRVWLRRYATPPVDREQFAGHFVHN